MPHLEQDVHEAFFFSQEALIAELTSATVVGTTFGEQRTSEQESFRRFSDWALETNLLKSKR